MEDSKKFIKNFIFFLILICVTFYILLKDQDINNIINVLSGVKIKYILFAAISMVGYTFCEAINAKRILNALAEKTKLLRCVKYTYTNSFYSAITPSSTGGQPMEVHSMHKDGIKISNATLTVLIQSCAFQIITLTYAILGIIFNHQVINAAILVLFIIGFVLNAFILMVYLSAVFSKRISNWSIKLFIKILKKFKVKNIEDREKRLYDGLEEYQASARFIKENKKMVFKTLFTTMIQIFLYYSVTYWVYCSFGFNKYNILQIVLMQAIVYTSTSGIPLPGAVGVSEGSFMSLFKKIFLNNTVAGAMLLSRMVSFYMLVLISGIVVIINVVKKGKKVEEEKNG